MASTTPTLDHNTLSNLQGGQSSQYYHLNSSLYNALTASPTSRLIGRYSAGTGVIQTLTLPKSITFNGSAVELVNDASSPGNSKYYGTNSLGTKGFYTLPSAASITPVDTDDIDLSYSSPSLSATLTSTGVSPDTYGSTTETIELIIDEKGRITSATNLPIVISTSSISNFLEATQDIIGNYLLVGSGLTLSYNDFTGFTTISSTIDTEGVQDSIGSILLDTSDIDFTYDDATPTISAVLTTTGVTPATYGSNTGASYPRITVNSKGRITSASNQFVYISVSQIDSFGPNVVGVVETSGLSVTEPWSFDDVITAPTLPTLPEHLVNKEYVDSLLSGVRTTSVRVSTTTSGTLASSFENGDTIDGVTLATNDRILIKNQVASEENGIYTVNASGAPTRATDMDAAGEVQATLVIVEEGTTNASTLWLTVSEVTVLNTDPITFTQVNLPWNVVAGDGMTLTGITLDVVTANSSNIVVSANDIDLATTAVTPDSYGAADTVPTFTVDAYGRLTAAADVLIDITASQVSDFTTSVQTLIDASVLDSGDLTPGTANQLLGTNNAASATEWKTLQGTTNQVSVTHGTNLITLAAPQDIHTAATPTFAGATFSATSPTVAITGSANAILTLDAPTGALITLTDSTSGGIVDIQANSSLGAYLKLDSNKTSSTTGGGYLLLQSNDGSSQDATHALGKIEFRALGGASPRVGATIYAKAESTFSGSSAPTYLSFETTPISAVASAERVRITSSGIMELRSGNGLKLYDSDNTNSIRIIPPSTGNLTADYTLTLPQDDGDANFLLTTNGSGVLSWTDPTSLTSTTIYSGDGSIPSSTTRTVTIDDTSTLQFLTTNSLIMIDDSSIAISNEDALIQAYSNNAGIFAPTGTAFLEGNEITIISENIILTVSDDDATGDIYYLNPSGKLKNLAIGTSGQVLTVNAGLPSWATPSGGGTPAGSNYNLQYYNSGAFGADSKITVVPGSQPKLAVGATTPLASLHGKSWNDAGSNIVLAENSSGDDIVAILSSGYTKFGNNETLPWIYQAGSISSTPSYDKGGLVVEGFFESSNTYDIFSIKNIELLDGIDGPYSVLHLGGEYTVSSGTGIYTSLHISPTIAQSGSFTGNAYGILFSPTLSGVVSNGYFDIVSTTNNSNSWFLYSTGANTSSYINGKLGLGTNTPTTQLEVAGTTNSTHYKGRGSTPTVTLGSSSVVGTGATYSITGTDSGFKLVITTGTGAGSPGIAATITFATAYSTAPYPVFSPASQWAATNDFLTSTVTSSAITFTTLGMTSSQAHIFYFNVIE